MCVYSFHFCALALMCVCVCALSHCKHSLLPLSLYIRFLVIHLPPILSPQCTLYFHVRALSPSLSLSVSSLSCAYTGTPITRYPAKNNNNQNKMNDEDVVELCRNAGGRYQEEPFPLPFELTLLLEGLMGARPGREGCCLGDNCEGDRIRGCCC